MLSFCPVSSHTLPKPEPAIFILHKSLGRAPREYFTSSQSDFERAGVKPSTVSMGNINMSDSHRCEVFLAMQHCMLQSA